MHFIFLIATFIPLFFSDTKLFSARLPSVILWLTEFCESECDFNEPLNSTAEKIVKRLREATVAIFVKIAIRISFPLIIDFLKHRPPRFLFPCTTHSQTWNALSWHTCTDSCFLFSLLFIILVILLCRKLSLLSIDKTHARFNQMQLRDVCFSNLYEAVNMCVREVPSSGNSFLRA